MWEEGTWAEAFHASCPDCTFVGEEPTKVVGGPGALITIDAIEKNVFHLAGLSQTGEAVIRMGKTWAVVDI